MSRSDGCVGSRRRKALRLGALLTLAFLSLFLGPRLAGPSQLALASGLACQDPHPTSAGSTCDAYFRGHLVGTLSVDKANPEPGEIVRLTVTVHYPPAQRLYWDQDPAHPYPDARVMNTTGLYNVWLYFPGGRLVDWGGPPEAKRNSNEAFKTVISWNGFYDGCASAGAAFDLSLPLCGIPPGSSIWADFEVRPRSEQPDWWEASPPANVAPYVGPRTAAVWFAGGVPEVEPYPPDHPIGQACPTCLKMVSLTGDTFSPMDPRAEVYLLDPKVSGTVRDAAGRPVPNQVVNIYRKSHATDAPCSQDPKPTPDFARLTNHEGKYSAFVESPTEYQVCPADSYGYDPPERDVSVEFIEEAFADFRFDGYLLSGNVTHGGEGVYDAEVVVTPSPANGDPPRSLFTDGDGHYETLLKKGAYSVSASGYIETCPDDPEEECVTEHLEGRPAFQLVSLESGDAEADFTLGAQARLELSLEFPAAAAVGDEIPITVHLNNAGTGTLIGANVTFEVDDPFGQSGLQLVDGPVPPLPDQIVSGQPFSTVYRFRAQDPGTPLVSFSAAAVQDGEPVEDGPEVARLTIGEPLKVEITVDRAAVALSLPARQGELNQGLYGWADPAPGALEFPQQVVVATVLMKNQSSTPVTNVALLGLHHGLNVASVKHVQEQQPDGSFEDRTVPLPVPGVFPVDVVEPFPQFEFDVIPPGDQKEVVYNLVVSNGGTFELRAEVRGANETGTVAGNASAEVEVTADVKLLVEAGIPLFMGQQPHVDEGGSYPVWGLLKNTTATDHIRFDPLAPITEFNGAALMLFEASAGAPVPTDDGRMETFAGRTLAPGESFWFTAIIQTAEFPGASDPGFGAAGLIPNRSDVRFQPSAWLVQSDGTETELETSQLRVDLGNGQPPALGGGPGEKLLRVRVDPRLVTPWLASEIDQLIYAYGTASNNLLAGAENGFVGTLEFAYKAAGFNAEFLTRPDKMMLRAYDISKYLGGAAAAMSPEDWAALSGRVGNALSQAGYRITNPQTWTNETLTNWFAEMNTAAESGDMQDLVQVWGKGFQPIGEYAGGEFATAAAIRLGAGLMIRDPYFRQAIETAGRQENADELAKLEDSAADNLAAGDPATHPPVPSVKALDAAKTGGMSPAQVQATTGMPHWVDQGVRDATRQTKTIIAFDPLPDYMQAWWNAAVRAVGKPEWAKVKSVNPETAPYLGYRPGAGPGIGDEGTLTLAEPLPDSVVNARVESLLDEGKHDLADAVADEHRRRKVEWETDERELGRKDMMRGATEVTRNGQIVRIKYMKFPKRGLRASDNKDGSGLSVEYELRRVEFRKVENPPDNDDFRLLTGKDREYWEVWAVNKDGRMARVVSDPDPILAMGVDGAILSREQAKAVADWLQTLGISHFWTMTWREKEKARAILAKYVWKPGGAEKHLLVYKNGEAGFGYLKDLDWLDDLWAGKPVHVKLVGGADTWADGLVQVPTTPMPPPVTTGAVPPYVPPLAGLGAIADSASDPEAEIQPLLARSIEPLVAPCADRYSRSPGALQIRVNDDLTVDAWTRALGWRPTSIGADCASGALAGLAVLPQTALHFDAEEGATEVRVIPLSSLVGAVSSAWFEVGDEIVIDPGGPNEELATVAGVAPFRLEQPLATPHFAREVVALVPADAPPNQQPECQPLTAEVIAGQSVVIAPNCADPDGDQLSYAITMLPAVGVAAVGPAGISYTAGAVAGEITFEYAALDATGSSLPARVTVTVTAPPPVVGLGVRAASIAPGSQTYPAVLAASGRLTLGNAKLKCSDDVSVRIGGAEQMIRGNRWLQIFGSCVYLRPLRDSSGFIAAMTYRPSNGEWILAGVSTSDRFAPFVNPVEFRFTFGPVSGSASLTFVKVRSSWYYTD